MTLVFNWVHNSQVKNPLQNVHEFREQFEFQCPFYWRYKVQKLVSSRVQQNHEFVSTNELRTLNLTLIY